MPCDVRNDPNIDVFGVASLAGFLSRLRYAFGLRQFWLKKSES